MSFPLWEAATAAGASLDELEKLEGGGYPVRFQAKLVAWHWLHQLVEQNKQDAVNRVMERRAKQQRKN